MSALLLLCTLAAGPSATDPDGSRQVRVTQLLDWAAANGATGMGNFRYETSVHGGGTLHAARPVAGKG